MSQRFLPGTLYYVRGPNGVGKTSLLKILVGLSEAAEGDVSSHLHVAGSESSQSLIYIGHKPGLSASLTAVENLRFWCDIQSVYPPLSFFMDVLMRMGLAGLEDIPVRYLSAGQQRRVALARLDCKPAACWVLDEPFTSLDNDGVQLMERKMAHFVSQGGCVILTSHQPLSCSAGDFTTIDLEYPLD